MSVRRVLGAFGAVLLALVLTAGMVLAVVVAGRGVAVS